MLEVYAKLVVDGADAVPMMAVAHELETALAGESFSARTEDGAVAHVVIDEVVIGDFAPMVAVEARSTDAPTRTAHRPDTREAAHILGDLAELIVGHEDEYPRGAPTALEIAVRALNPDESAGCPVEIEPES